MENDFNLGIGESRIRKFTAAEHNHLCDALVFQTLLEGLATCLACRSGQHNLHF